MKFVLCTGCDRHVNDADTVCPFCGADAFRSAPARTRRGPRGRMLVAGLAASITACSEGDSGPVDGAVVDAGHQHPADAAADASTTDATTDGEVETDADLEASVPIYDAVPPMPDPES